MNAVRQYILEALHPLERRAKEVLGTTTDYQEAGYILTDGSLLDFSGRAFGPSGYGQRNLDHRQIRSIAYDYKDNKETYLRKYDTDMMSFMKKTGAIRFGPEGGPDFLTFDMEKPLTSAQKRTVLHLAMRYGRQGFGVEYRGRDYMDLDLDDLIRLLRL